MTLFPLRRRSPRPDRFDRWSDMLRGAAVAVVPLGAVGSVLVSRAWETTVDRQRDERLDRTKTSRTASIDLALGDIEKALRAAHSLWLASERGGRGGLHHPAARPAGRLLRHQVQLSVQVAGRPGRPRDPGVLTGLECARDSGETVISSRTTLDEDRDLPRAQRPMAYELIVPVYDSDTPLDDVAERRRRFLGWASGQFRASDFLAAAMKAPTLRNPTGVELHDEQVGTASLVASYPPGFRTRGPYLREDRRTIPGGSFVLRYAPLPGNPVLTEQTFPPPPVLLIGIAASVLLGALLWLLAQVGALYREVGRLARTDSLTGVPNRRAWDEELPRELARAARSGQPVCVALLDVDHFKAYNDRHGHQAGDRFLKEAAAAWQAVVRKTDMVTRYGGEEFAILLPDCRLDNAMEIAERLRTAQPEGSCSLGVARWDGREDTTALVARADRALYAVKEAGRNRVCADAATAVETAAP